ncbi:hypothetical protein FRC12_005763 [Ceratobasidium sp. 428]|nr:hypothetical protein FRC12_005763 [Ceratobasidium sp. 428]
MTLSGSGHRIPCSTQDSIPEFVFETQTEFRDLGGQPVYVASALMDNAVHPCKCVPHLEPPCRVPYGGGEHGHYGRYDILPVTNDMEWVPGEGGVIPYGRTPVEGGYEGEHALYHAYAEVSGVKVPGKAGSHLGGANVAFGGREVAFSNNYFVLCWKEQEMYY